MAESNCFQNLCEMQNWIFRESQAHIFHSPLPPLSCNLVLKRRKYIARLCFSSVYIFWLINFSCNSLFTIFWTRSRSNDKMQDLIVKAIQIFYFEVTYIKQVIIYFFVIPSGQFIFSILLNSSQLFSFFSPTILLSHLFDSKILFLIPTHRLSHENLLLLVRKR